MAKKDGKSTGNFAYRLNGHIGTEGAASLRYGFAAARIKTHKLRGQHGGFWMRPTIAGGGDPRAEIDVIEYFGDKHPQGGLTSFIYSTKNNKAVKTGSWIKSPTSFLKNKKDGWSKNYHVFSVEWTPKMYIFRIDGKETYRTKVGVSDQAAVPDPERAQLGLRDLADEGRRRQASADDVAWTGSASGRPDPPGSTPRTATRRPTSVGRRVSHVRGRGLSR